MAKYFSLYPKAVYNRKLATDLLVRTKIKETWLGDPTIYYNYVYKDGDRPEHIAQKYYGDEDLHWIILFTNNAFNPFFDFPLNSTNFDNYINDKYKNEGEKKNISGIEYAQTTPDPLFRYQKQVTTYKEDGSFERNYYAVDKKSYFELPVEVSFDTINTVNGQVRYENIRRTPEVTIYEKEYEDNDSKRLIKILRKTYIQQAKIELLNLLQ